MNRMAHRPQLKVNSGVGEIGAALKKWTDGMDRMARRIQDMRLATSEAACGSEGRTVPWDAHVPRIPDLSTSILEAKQRRETLEEERFEQLHGIVTDAVQIATGLQTVVAEFLQKFERSAADSARTARRAVWISVGAMLIAVIMTTVQIAYSEYRRESSNGTEILATLQRTQTELSAMRNSHVAVSERLSKALALSDSETAAVLRDIRTLLSREADASAPVPEALQP